MEDELGLMATAAMLAQERAALEACRDRLDRSDPRGRHLSLAITHLEDAELRLAHASAFDD